MKKLLLLAFVFVTFNAFASSKETWVCIKNITGTQKYVNSFDDSDNNMWDGSARPNKVLNDFYLAPNESKCARLEINASSKQLKAHDGYYSFVMTTHDAGSDMNYGYNVLALNSHVSYMWGLWGYNSNTSLDASENKLEYNPSGFMKWFKKAIANDSSNTAKVINHGFDTMDNGTDTILWDGYNCKTEAGQAHPNCSAFKIKR